MSEIDLASLREILPRFAAQGRSGLLPALHAAQGLYGWLPFIEWAIVNLFEHFGRGGNDGASRTARTGKRKVG